MAVHTTFTQAFQEWDLDGDGYISKSEFRSALARIGMPQQDADRMFCEADANHDQKIELSEFCQWIAGTAPANVRSYVLQIDHPLEAFYLFMDFVRNSAVPLRSLFDKMDISGSGVVSANEFTAIAPSFHCGVRKERMLDVFLWIECPPGSQGRLQPDHLVAMSERQVRRRPSRSRRPSLRSEPKAGPCGVCGGIPPQGDFPECPPPSCGHWEWSPAGWFSLVCFTCLNFPPQGKYHDKTLSEPSCRHWAFSTKHCGCRAPDDCWHAHICMVCIDFQPTSFSGLPTKGPAPSCGHWVWFNGAWIRKQRYDELMKEKQRKEEKQEQMDEVKDMLPCSRTASQCQGRQGYFSFAQFKQAYQSSE
eukprot:gnl/TRDRNA2_/TRDRNA2_38043_c1_seq1.p1 gnl/TRDRNA2_/TRDRNA2_38043_c1~~gnl/TRDRNA2_/TRDRNA2_38043_c1_seq1.p1  ORF type:complete len:362 (+),score=39.75 gnl/TRDRNA2_/TRDRNA2_38043_c1_seq1:76-1161(+)